jgi:hypothetical protein
MGGETVVGKALGYAPPSAFARAAVSLLLLAGFYLLLLGVAAGLFVVPIAAISRLVARPSIAGPNGCRSHDAHVRG